MIIGYTTGVYDLFHIGHLNLLKNAKGMCDRLVVGVTTDELVSYKNKKALIPFEERIEIVRSIKYVDAAVPQYNMDKVTACKKIGANILFVGDDWYATEKWQTFENELNKIGVKVVYFPYTKGISSTILNNTLQAARDHKDKLSNPNFDKDFCMSSYLAFRFIEDDDKNFYQHLAHHNLKPNTPPPAKTPVKSAKDIDAALTKTFSKLKGEKLGLLLSGGMDSAILAAYMPGADAFTFRFLGGKFQKDELSRAKYYADKYHLNLHYVDIDWHTVENYLDCVMKTKNAPVHSIEPQLLQAALQAKALGVTKIVIGNDADSVFGGMDQLLSKDWTFEEFKQRYTFLDPKEVLVNPVDMTYLYERYRKGNNIDFQKFIKDVGDVESDSSYDNAFKTAQMDYLDPYTNLTLAEPLDLKRIRNGESKYLIRELFKMKYPDYPVPEKIPMPRPVDQYFKDWTGPKRPEFKQNLDMHKFTGNQKWQMYCLERFLNLHEPLTNKGNK